MSLPHAYSHHLMIQTPNHKKSLSNTISNKSSCNKKMGKRSIYKKNGLSRNSQMKETSQFYKTDFPLKKKEEKDICGEREEKRQPKRGCKRSVVLQNSFKFTSIRGLTGFHHKLHSFLSSSFFFKKKLLAMQATYFFGHFFGEGIGTWDLRS